MALHLMPKNESKWIPKVITSSALEDKGIDVFWEKAFDFEKHIENNNWKEAHRKEQMHYWAEKSIQDILLARASNYSSQIAEGLESGKLPEQIAKELLS